MQPTSSNNQRASPHNLLRVQVAGYLVLGQQAIVDNLQVVYSELLEGLKVPERRKVPGVSVVVEALVAVAASVRMRILRGACSVVRLPSRPNSLLEHQVAEAYLEDLEALGDQPRRRKNLPTPLHRRAYLGVPRHRPRPHPPKAPAYLARSQLRQLQDRQLTQ